LPDLEQLGSPYLGGILDAADEQMLLLETTRGCVFKCKFCYYPKSYDKQYYLGADSVLANLRHARERGTREVFLLDPTLNQRRDFADFLRILSKGNPGQTFSYFGELRGEGVTEEMAKLLRQANFTEVEVGLQSIDAEAMRQMDRKNNLRAFERGVRAMMQEGIAVKVDLIIGLPGDTPESVRRGLHYLHDTGLDTDVQVFNLSILPGTAFRQEAEQLGLKFQPRPPYYLLETPTMDRTAIYELMHEAQELFGIEFDAQPPPVLQFEQRSGLERVWAIDLDRDPVPSPPREAQRTQAFTLWLCSRNFHAHSSTAARCIERLLHNNPFTTLQVVLEPSAPLTAALIQSSIGDQFLERLTAVCQSRPTYLDRFYALQPGRANGAKRLVVVLPWRLRSQLDPQWLDTIGDRATLMWDCAIEGRVNDGDLAAYEHVRLG
jgi:hypothetical protein